MAARGKVKKKAKRKKKYVYFFGAKNTEGSAKMRNLLGGKGANLAEMTRLGIPVPPGFTITTEACIEYYNSGERMPAGLDKQVWEKVGLVEREMGLKFGDVANPLLLSVRSGARVSMPGMMDSVLNLGLNDETVKGIVSRTGNPKFVYDSYRRFIQMYSDVVLGVEHDFFEHALTVMKKRRGVKLDMGLSAEDFAELVEIYKKIVRDNLGKNFPASPEEQLWGGIGAVFRSWNTKRAVEYRRINGIPNDWGTAVNVQTMVFGNMGDDSATGVAFTRDPSTGEKKFFGEFLINAQGEDVVAGIRTPQPINVAPNSMEKLMPSIYKELAAIYKRLERHYREMQDIEFTVQQGKLWMLQTRTGKRTAAAAVKIAVDMVREKLVSDKEALLRVGPDQLDQLLHPMIDPKASKDVVATGLPASPGAAVGKAVFSADEAREWVEEKGEKVILVRLETSPDDIHGMHAAEGILTARGGLTSHAAVVARGMGKCCVAGCGDIHIDYEKEQFTVGSHTVVKGDWLTLDGTRGEVILGQVPTVKPALAGDFGVLMKWADKYRRLGVRANADTPHDAEVARSFGAQGIGLCRTEHMFFEPDRIDAVREMILAENKEGRERALAKILPMQKSDFKGIFLAMKGLPVTVRLLDPPLHEFLPHTDEEIKGLAGKMGVAFEKLKSKVAGLHEFNPMLGHRGCRLGIVYPEIYEMQVRAIMEAACELAGKKVRVMPEIEIPLVGHVNEFKFLCERCEKICRDVMKEKRQRVKYKIGTMIELPRAAITSNLIAGHADFFSFGTNDLTQTTFGLSRDDASKFLGSYVKMQILGSDPFVTIDQDGVGELMRYCVDRARKVKKNLEIGICGEHGGEPVSVRFCHGIGLNYVSCSPYRVPVARLAAAQAALNK